MAEPRWLSEDEDRAWRGWLTMSELLRAQIARDLQSDCGLSESDFAVLVHLSETPDDRMRMTELADALGWSKSRVSHQCSRMAARKLLAREGCPEDARSAYAVLTPIGRVEIQRAAPLHVESVRRHLIDLLGPDDLQAVTGISERITSHLRDVGTDPAGASCPSLPPCPTRGVPAVEVLPAL
jgi:DNA-binding MarR family transcriptional regulator